MPSVELAEMGMPTTYQVACRQYGHTYLAALQEAARVMQLGMEGGADPVSGRWHTPVSPVDLLPSIIYSTMKHCGGLADGVTFLPMVETERTGKKVTRKDRLGDILWDFLEATARDLQTGEGLCFSRDGAWSERTIARTVNRIDALFPDSRSREGLAEGAA